MKDKLFIYCESEEYGMRDFYVHHPDDLQQLYGWMKQGGEWACYDKDMALVEWMKDARIGDVYRHRLGVMIRVNPGQEEV